jgi:hypothetical protein
MAIASNPGPFSGDTQPYDRNRIRRITFLVGPTKTVAHVDNRGSGSKGGYEKARDDSQDPANIHVTERARYITEEE